MLLAFFISSALASNWTSETYVRPIFGASIYNSNETLSTAAQFGVTAGVFYWKPINKMAFVGRTRASGTFLGTNNANGLDLRIGSFIGPQWKYIGFDTGGDIFWDYYTAHQKDILPASVGVDFPINITLGPSELYIMAGITTAILYDKNRRVNWDDLDYFGFGHEQGWQIGTGLSMGRFQLQGTYGRRTVISGHRSSIGFSVKMN